MSALWVDDTGFESAEYDDSEGAELYDDSDSEDYGEESRASVERRRRAQRRRVALARRRQAQSRASSAARGRPVGAPPAAQRQTVAAIRNLDLETKVQEDSLRSAIAAQSKRMNRSEYASVAGAATNQFIESFDAPDNHYARAGLRFAPLLLLSPQKRGTGFEAIVKDPRVIGALAVAAIAVAGHNRNRFTGPKEINILSSAELTEGDDDRFVADVVDGSGRVVGNTVTWDSDDDNVATIGPTTGAVHAVSEGTAIISASFDGLVRRVRLKVDAAVE